MWQVVYPDDPLPQRNLKKRTATVSSSPKLKTEHFNDNPPENLNRISFKKYSIEFFEIVN